MTNTEPPVRRYRYMRRVKKRQWGYISPLEKALSLIELAVLTAFVAGLLGPHLWLGALLVPILLIRISEMDVLPGILYGSPAVAGLFAIHFIGFPRWILVASSLGMFVALHAVIMAGWFRDADRRQREAEAGRMPDQLGALAFDRAADSNELAAMLQKDAALYALAFEEDPELDPAVRAAAQEQWSRENLCPSGQHLKNDWRCHCSKR